MTNPLPKKSLGQHWLHDYESLEAMCVSARVTDEDTVVEVGPGLGTLTKLLLQRARSVIAVEFDPMLAQSLAKNVADDEVNTQSLTVVNEDILSFDFGSVPHPYKVVANIPYYLTSNLLRVMSESSNSPTTAVLLMQKEVAQRVCAQPGDMSILAVTAQFYWEVSLGRIVEAELFTPPPKVDSQILIMHYRSRPLFPDVDSKQFFRLVRAGFGQKRKTLENALSAGLRLSKSEAKKLLENSGIQPSARAQVLSLEDWYHLYVSYHSGR